RGEEPAAVHQIDHLIGVEGDVLGSPAVPVDDAGNLRLTADGPGTALAGARPRIRLDLADLSHEVDLLMGKRAARPRAVGKPGFGAGYSCGRRPAQWVPGTLSGTRTTSGWRRDPVVKRDAAVDGNRGAGDVAGKPVGEQGERHVGHVLGRAEAAERDLAREIESRRVEATAGHGPWRQRVDADAGGPERPCELLDDHGLPGLRGRVVGKVARGLGVEGGDEQHATLDAA